MAFTSSHYLEVAKIIREARATRVDDPMVFLHVAMACEECARYVAEKIQRDLSAMFARQNPKFNAERFAADCTPKQE